MKYQSRADLLIAAGESIKMQTAAGIEPMQKYGGSVIPIIVEGKFHIGDKLGLNEFPLAVVEGKPVFVGDELYSPLGMRFIVDENGMPCCPNTCSWNPPKPVTVTVEYTIDEAKRVVTALEQYQVPVAAETALIATRKALEKA